MTESQEPDEMSTSLDDGTTAPPAPEEAASGEEAGEAASDAAPSSVEASEEHGSVEGLEEGGAAASDTSSLASSEETLRASVEDAVTQVEAVAEAAGEEMFQVALEEAVEEAAADGVLTEDEVIEAVEAATEVAGEVEVSVLDEGLTAIEEVLEGSSETVPEPAAEEPAAEEPAAEEPAAKPVVEEEPETAVPGPFKGPGEWYVVHTYAGYENKVKTNLESRIHTMQMEEKIFDVHIPMEDVMEIKAGKRQVVQRKVFPGYLLVKMIYDNDSWYVVRNTPGVTGFVAAGTGAKPTPLSRREVEKILVVKKDKDVKPTFRLGFEEGDVVRIITGPFADFNGTISEINIDQSKLKVLVNIFDRETPVELGFDQVAKV